MNRRDRLGIDERRREANSNRDPNNSVPNERSLKESYFQSQKVIQSLTALPGFSEIDAPKTKSFRIPRKQNQPKEIFDESFQGRSDIHEPRNELFSNIQRRPTEKNNKFIIREKSTNQEQKQLKRINKIREHKIHNKTKPIQVHITNLQNGDGKIAPQNVQALTETLTKLIKRSIIENYSRQSPKFLGYRYEDGSYRVVCANYSSRGFLINHIKEIPPAWPGAKLKADFTVYKEFVCTAVLPETIPHFSEFIDLCQKWNSKLLIENFRCISKEDIKDDPGKLFTFALDPYSYELIMKEHNGSVRCGNNDIKLNLVY